jgi:GNAT superfamily N-acetyltransferase
MNPPAQNTGAPQPEHSAFFEKSALMGVELLDLLDNYRLIVHDADAAYHHLKQTFPLVAYDPLDRVPAIEPDMAVQRMLGDAAFLDHIGVNKGRLGALLFRFQANEQLDALIDAGKMVRLVAPSALQARLGSKLYLPTLRAALGAAQVPLVPSRVFLGQNDASGATGATSGHLDGQTSARAGARASEDGAAIFAACAAEFGLPFIVQGAHGVAGDDTFLIENPSQLAHALAATQGRIRAARYIAQHISLSTHICVGDAAPLIRGPYLQLVGLPELTAHRFRFCGNDTNQSLFDVALTEQARTISAAIAQHVKAQGYLGIFGIDFIRDNSTGALYVQELNMRMVGLTRLLTGMQKDQGILPDLLAHLRAHGCATVLRADSRLSGHMSGQADSPMAGGPAQHDYAQFMIRHRVPMAPAMQQVQHYLEPGIYRWQAGHMQKRSDSLFVHDMAAGEWLVLMAASLGSCPAPGDLLARIIVKESILAPGEYRLNQRFCQLVAAVRRRILGTDTRTVPVRALALTDLAALEPILKAHIRDRHSGAVIGAEVDAVLRQMQGDPDCAGRVRHYWVALAADGCAIGCMAWAAPDVKMAHHFMQQTAGNRAIELLNAFIHPELPGQGVGRALFEAICTQGRLANASALLVNSGLRYQANWGFYDRVCDASHGFIADYYGPNRPAKTWLKRL